MTELSVTANHRMTAERGALVRMSGHLDTAAVVALRTQLDAATAEFDIDYVAVDLSGATGTARALFTMLALTDGRLRARASRLVLIGLHHDVLSCLDQAPLWAVFTLYRASRQSLPPGAAIGTAVGDDTLAVAPRRRDVGDTSWGHGSVWG